MTQSATQPAEGGPRTSLLGAPGSYHDIACDYLSPATGPDERVRCDSFAAIFQQLADGEVDQAVMAVANSEIGALWDAYSTAAQHDSFAVGEVNLRIRHNLLVLPEVESPDEIKTVLSNPKALKQCEDFLAAELPDASQQTGTDTAGCAEQIAEAGDPSHAAIASRQAAEIYGLKILHAGIETNPNNQTRFLLFGNKTRLVPDADKTSVILATPNHPRALYDALGVWATRDIGLSMLESRLVPHQVRNPWGAYLHAQGQHSVLEGLRESDPTDPWDAHFYVDIDAGLQAPDMREAMRELQEQPGVEVRVLGSYVAGQVVE